MTKGDSATITGTIFVRGEVDGQSGLWYRVNTKAGVNGWVFGIYIQMEPVFVRQDGEVAVENWCLSKSGFEARLKTINDALADFRTLTDLLKENSNPKTDLNRGEIQRSTSPSYTFVIKQSDLFSLTQNAGLDWDIQNIGFYSWPEILQACEQALVLNNAELRLEIGKLKKATAEELGKLESTVEDERQKMVRFADQARPGE